jgi:hypothetical protein
MDSYLFGDHKSWLFKVQFLPSKTICNVSWITNLKCFQKIRFVDLYRRLIFNRFNLFSRIQRILTNPHKSLVHRRTMNKSVSIQILCFRCTNLYPVQKICFMDSFCPTVFKRFFSWISFVLLCSKDLFFGFVL